MPCKPGTGPRAPRPQLDLFAAPAPPPGGGVAPSAGDPRRRRLNAALDALAEKFGERAVRPADLDDGPPVVGQGRYRKPRGDGG